MRTTIPWLLAAMLCLTLSAPAKARADAPAHRGDWSFDLVDDAGQRLPTFTQGGRTYVLGVAGQRYRLRIRNGSDRRVEVVASVDGRDVLDGGPSSLAKHGYVVDAHGETIIDGYRLSESVVAVFRFGAVSRSYAALEGDARDVGVIGVAVFPERRPRRVALPESAPLELRDRSAGAEAGGRSEEAPAAAKAAPRPGLGTTFGEEHDSRVRRVAFVRESARPAVLLTLRYDDRPGLIAAGVDLDPGRCGTGDASLRRSADPFRRDPGFARPPKGWTPAGS
ncbi:MAG: hypothetical protein RJA59_2107 [Pseudomonadota bacterium]